MHDKASWKNSLKSALKDAGKHPAVYLQARLPSIKGVDIKHIHERRAEEKELSCPRSEKSIRVFNIFRRGAFSDFLGASVH